MPPTVLLAGWQDLFLRGSVDDYVALAAADRPVKLIVGDWTHHDEDCGAVAFGEAVRLFQAFDRPPVPTPVRVEVTNDIGWRSLDRWPPISGTRTFYPAAGGELGDRPVSSGTVWYRYDPADPTPQGGGRTLNASTAGRRSQRERERRDDVLTFTSDPLAEDLTVIGAPSLDISIASTNPRVDLFIRVCEVDQRGRSHTVTDGYLRTAEDPTPGALRALTVDLDATAYRLRAGYRLRLQVSSGAHPLHLRNSGSADPLRDFSRLVASDQHVALGDTTALHLPVPPA